MSAGEIGLVDKVRLVVMVMADSSLSATAKNAFTALALKYLNTQTGDCRPAYGTLAGALGVGRRAAIRAVAEIEREGWIRIIREGGQSTNSYQLAFGRLADAHAPEGVPSVTPEGCHPRHHDGVETDTPGVSSATPELRNRTQGLNSGSEHGVVVALHPHRFDDENDDRNLFGEIVEQTDAELRRECAQLLAGEGLEIRKSHADTVRRWLRQINGDVRALHALIVKADASNVEWLVSYVDKKICDGISTEAAGQKFGTPGYSRMTQAFRSAVPEIEGGAK